MNRVILVTGAVILAGGIWLALSSGGLRNGNSGDETSGDALVEIVPPDTLSTRAQRGQTAFEANCAGCHGVNAVGRDGLGPPLIHKIYEPSHHGDEAFQRAVALGVRSHHWRFGNMAPVPGLTRADVEPIIAYVRAVQQANGIN